MNDKKMGDLLEGACIQLNRQEEKELQELIVEASQSAEVLPRTDQAKIMKKCLPLLHRQRIKNATLAAWKKEGKFFKSFSDLLKASIARCGISRGQIAKIAGQDEGDIEKFEKLETPIAATKNITKLVNLLDVFGITVNMLSEIVKNENWGLATSFRTASTEEEHGMAGATSKDDGKLFQPNQTEFFKRIREEIKSRELDDLL